MSEWNAEKRSSSFYLQVLVAFFVLATAVITYFAFNPLTWVRPSSALSAQEILAAGDPVTAVSISPGAAVSVRYTVEPFPSGGCAARLVTNGYVGKKFAWTDETLPDGQRIVCPAA